LPIAIRSYCDPNQVKQLVLPAIVVDNIWTIQVWVRQLNCNLQSTAEYILEKEKYLIWYYAMSTRQYKFIINDQEISGQNMQAVVLNKWQHFTLSNGPVGGLQFIRNAKDLIGNWTYVSQANRNLTNIYLASSSGNNYRFEGNLKEFRLWSKELTLAEMLNNFDRSLLSCEFESIIQYFRLNEGNGPIFLRDAKNNSAISSGVLDWEVTSEDPICCKTGDNCAAKHWNGIHCTDERKFIYLDGTYFLTMPAITISSVNSQIGVGFWFKHLERPIGNLASHSYPATLLYIPKGFHITYNYNYEPTSGPASQAEIVNKDLTGTLSVSIKVSKEQNVWTHVSTLKNPGNPRTFYLSLNGHTLPSKYYAEATGKVGANPISSTPFIGGYAGAQGLFPGFVRNIIFTNTANAATLDIYRDYSRQFLAFYLSTAVLSYYKLNEGDGNVIYNYAIYPPSAQAFNKILWVTDVDYLTICPEDLIPEFIPKINRVCCKEDFTYEFGEEPTLNEIQLPIPSSTWSTDGTICFNIYVPYYEADPTSRTIFSMAPLEIKFRCNLGTYYFDILQFGVSLGIGSFPLDTSRWVPVCLSFGVTGAVTYLAFFDATSETNIDRFYNPTLTDLYYFTPTATALTIYSSTNTKPTYIKHVMLMDIVYNWYDMRYIYLEHLHKAGPLQTRWLFAYWRLDESATFTDLSPNKLTWTRTGHNIGPSAKSIVYRSEWRQSQGVICPALYQKCPPDYVQTNIGIGGNTIHRCTNMKLASIDFAQMAHKASFDTPFINLGPQWRMNEKSTKIQYSPFSSVHGIITDDISYKDTYIYLPYSNGNCGLMLSIWFYKKSISPATLFAVYNSITNVPLFKMVASDHLRMIGPAAQCSTQLNHLAVTFTTSIFQHIFL